PVLRSVRRRRVHHIHLTYRARKTLTMLATATSLTSLISPSSTFLQAGGSLPTSLVNTSRPSASKLRRSFPVRTLYGMYVQVQIYHHGEEVVYNGESAIVDRQNQEGWLWLYRPGSA